MGSFRLLVLAPDELTPVAGAAVRLLQGSTDVGGTIWGASPVYTGPDGVFSYTYQTDAAPVPTASYTLVVVASGFAEYSNVIAGVFTGTGSISAVLAPGEAFAPAITAPAAYVSSLFAVPVTISGESAPTGSLIQTEVASDTGAISLMNTPIIGDEALVNLQARLRLIPLLHLVADADNATTDPDFSGTFTAAFARRTVSGVQDIDETVVVHAAPIVPTGTTNDLTNYTNSAGLAKWITPWAELPKFAGHYAAASIWLEGAAGVDFTLNITYLNINRSSTVSLTRTLPAALFAAGKTVAVKIPEAPSATTYYARLIVTQGEIAQTEPLIVRYIH